MLIKLTVDFLSRYIEKRANMKPGLKDWLKIVISSLIYFSITLIVATTKQPSELPGVLGQIQVIISVYLVVSVSNIGYITAVSLNLISSLISLNAVLNHYTEAIPGIIIPFCDIISITIIKLYSTRLINKLSEVNKKNLELKELYHDLAAAESQYWMQNKRLEEYNRIVEEEQKQLNQLTYFDVPTGLPNRQNIMNRLDMLIGICEKKNLHFTIVLINFDSIKCVNDTVGHHTGDNLIQAAVSKLKAHIHPSDMIGRLGADDYMLLIQRQISENQIISYVDGLRQILASSIHNGQNVVPISARFGICRYPQDGNNVTTLLKGADIAMSYAKSSGKDMIKLYSEEMSQEAEQKRLFSQRLALGVENSELNILFQPQYYASSQQIRGLEALVRWQSPDLGTVMPGEFISVAEKNGLILQMGEWILRQSCSSFMKQKSIYREPIILAVNISSVQLMAPGFVQSVKNILNETGLCGKLLELDMTESVFISSMDNVIRVLSELKSLGIRIALDDFGTGYSSLSCLQMLPIDTLKIDRSFVGGMLNVPVNKQIVGSIISLAHQLGLSVIAEGVENEQQLDYLKQYDCDCIQGYLLSKPLDEEAVCQLLTNYAAK